ncbi:hypothetical protein [Trueperella pyogenes]|uniref:hypothetical protein n=1 Tax=Trueperella pyogenes TaxID=1661 RepID=UPI0032500645
MAGTGKARARARVDELVDASTLDLTAAGRERARVYHSQPEGWVRLDKVFGSMRAAQAVADAWADADPASYGGVRAFEGRAFPAVTKNWWAARAQRKMFLVEVRLVSEGTPAVENNSGETGEGHDPAFEAPDSQGSGW